MEIRDPVHGSIDINDLFIPVITHPFFQRLRGIKQLGFSDFAFPGATHTRYLHSIGVMHIGRKVFEKIFRKHSPSSELNRLRETLTMACLLHDIGHAPLSHSTESVMPNLSKLDLPNRFNDSSSDRQATHEDYTIKAIVDSEFTQSFELLRKEFGVDPNCIAELITGETKDPDYFKLDGVNYFPVLHQMVSSEMDCDRMDYLLRDSYFCGVSYGQYDLDWIIDNLGTGIYQGNAHLGISERAVATFDDFLLSRFHMFMMVYFHYRAVCMEKMLEKYFQEARTEYSIPHNIEEYQKHDDNFLIKVLKDSQNGWAQRVLNNNIPLKVLEIFGEGQRPKMDRLKSYLDSQQIDAIVCSSVGRLSKYYRPGENQSPKFPMLMIRSFLEQSQSQYMPIDEATVIFKKFSQVHSVERIHFDFYQLPDKNRDEILAIIGEE